MKGSTMRFLSDERIRMMWRASYVVFHRHYVCHWTNFLIAYFSAHHFIFNSGACVRLAEEQGISIDTLTFEQLQQIDSRFDKDVMQVWDYETSVERKCSTGGTAKARVLEQIEKCLAFAKTL